MAAASPFALRVPIDDSQTPEFTSGPRTSVLAWNAERRRQSPSEILLNEGVLHVPSDLPSKLDVNLTAGEGTRRESGAEWTLVDYLFPSSRPYAAAIPSRSCSALPLTDAR